MKKDTQMHVENASSMTQQQSSIQMTTFIWSAGFSSPGAGYYNFCITILELLAVKSIIKMKVKYFVLFTFSFKSKFSLLFLATLNIEHLIFCTFWKYCFNLLGTY